MSSNAFAFRQKRPCVLLQMHLRFRSNVLAFFSREKVFLLKNLAVKNCPIRMDEAAYVKSCQISLLLKNNPFITCRILS